MKKFFYFAAALLVMASCSSVKEDPKNLNETPAIGFSIYTQNLTKGRAEASSTFATGDKFKVFGVKTTGTSSLTVFDGVEVTLGTAWTYSPIKFWDYGSDSYDFFAYSNATGTITYTASSNNGLFAQAAEQTFAGNDGDVLVAAKKTVAKAAYGQQVALAFNHITSLVDVKVKASATFNNSGSNYPQVAVNEVTLNNIENKGKFTVTNYTNTIQSQTTAPTVTWTTADSPASTIAYDNLDGVTYCLSTDGSSCDDPLILTTTYQNAIKDLIVKPQTIGDAKTVTVNYTIKYSATEEETVERTIKLNEFRSVEDTDASNPHNNGGTAVFSEWEQGNHYIYNITVNADPITFTSSIIGWVENQGYWYIAK